MLNFHFLEKKLRIDSPPYFAHDFARKIVLILYSINWRNFIVWLPLLLDILDNMCIAIVCSPGCDVINIEIHLIFLIKLLFYVTKQYKYLNIYI